MKLILNIFLIFFSLYNICLAQSISENAGNASMLFLRSNFSAKVTALGNTYTGLAEDNNAMHYNPAGLASIPGDDFSLNHTEWYEQINFDNVSLKYKINNKFVIGASLSHMWMPGIEGRNINGDLIRDVNVSSSIMQLSAAYEFILGNYLGLSFKYYIDHLAYKTATGFAFDIGYLLHTIIPDLSLGFLVKNLGPEVKYTDKGYEIPLTVRTGISYKLRKYNTTFLADIVKSKDTDFYYSFGTELKLMNLLALRIGNEIRTFRFFNLAGGFGIKIRDKLQFNYSISSPGELGIIHSVGIDIKMDNKK